MAEDKMEVETTTKEAEYEDVEDKVLKRLAAELKGEPIVKKAIEFTYEEMTEDKHE